jgi:hypothetical protein
VLPHVLVQGNAAAKDTIISTWRPTSAMASANGGSSTQDAAVNDTAAAVAGPEGAAKDKTADALLPKLQPELYVDEDTLSRLFLVTSKVAKEVKVRPMRHLVEAAQQTYVCLNTVRKPHLHLPRQAICMQRHAHLHSSGGQRCT